MFYLLQIYFAFFRIRRTWDQVLRPYSKSKLELNSKNIRLE